MKANELRKKDVKELNKSIVELRKKLSDIRFASSSNQLKNVKEIKNIKKEIARSLTVIKEQAENIDEKSSI